MILVFSDKRCDSDWLPAFYSSSVSLNKSSAVIFEIGLFPFCIQRLLVSTQLAKETLIVPNRINQSILVGGKARQAFEISIGP